MGRVLTEQAPQLKSRTSHDGGKSAHVCAWRRMAVQRRTLLASTRMSLRASAKHGLGHTVPARFTWATLLALGGLPALALACGGQSGARASVFGRLEGATEIFFAHESSPTCALEASPGEKAATDEAQWVKVPANALTNRQFTVMQKSGGGGKGATWTRALALRASGGEAMWVRNVAAATPQEADERWSCAVPGKDVQALSFDLHATTVQLLPYGPKCHAITPIMGSGDDVRFAPYALVARRLFIGADKKPVLGLTLATPGNDRLLTVSASDLQSCFGVVAPSVLSPEETTAFLTWVTLPAPDAKAAPPNPWPVRSRKSRLVDMFNPHRETHSG